VILLATHTAVALAAACGIVYLVFSIKEIFAAVKALAAAAMLLQVVWLIMAAVKFPYCVLLDPWGGMAFVTLAVIGSSWWATRSYRTPWMIIVGLVLSFLAITGGHRLLPSPGAACISMKWVLGFHILLIILGFSTLLLGCIAGVMILLRSRSLKSLASTGSSIPWPALTALDRLFVRSIGIGILLLTAGIVTGVFAVAGASITSAWYLDPKVVLTLAGCVLYALVWVMRRRQGFCSRTVVALATLGFACVLIGFFATSLFTAGFHHF